jgi:hypothetical protein
MWPGYVEVVHELNGGFLDSGVLFRFIRNRTRAVPSTWSSGFAWPFRIDNLVDRVGRFFNVFLKLIERFAARCSSLFHRVLEILERVGHVVEVGCNLAQLAVSVHGRVPLQTRGTAIDASMQTRLYDHTG